MAKLAFGMREMYIFVVDGVNGNFKLLMTFFH